MPLSRFIFALTAFLFPFALVATAWLYTYPVWKGCGFPSPVFENEVGKDIRDVAPFRLLALGDPQLEGDSSLPGRQRGFWGRFGDIRRDYDGGSGGFLDRLRGVKSALREVLTLDLPLLFQTYRKKLDLWGNDYYLAHIVRTMRWYAKPTHVAVLGDLLGSQWIGDEEFEKRRGRYWGRVFRGLERVGDEVMDHKGPRIEILGGKRWDNRVVNVVGNHDVGYAGDLNEERVRRFERGFGKVNWDVVFRLPQPNISNSSREYETQNDDIPSLRLVVLNSMNLDSPAVSSELQTETYDFLNRIISTTAQDSQQSTILLTHIPLYKPTGYCVDEPFFDYWHDGGIREQNMLSQYASEMLLQEVLGLGNKDGGKGKGIVVNGHDHEGCDVLHYVPEGEREGMSEAPEDTDSVEEDSTDKSSDTYPFLTHRLPSSPSTPKSPTPLTSFDTSNPQPHIREITLRAMMGQYDGAAGLVSAWWDPSAASGAGQWKFDVDVCILGVQHLWWGVHVLDLVVLGGVVLGVGCRILERWRNRRISTVKQKGEKGK